MKFAIHEFFVTSLFWETNIQWFWMIPALKAFLMLFLAVNFSPRISLVGIVNFVPLVHKGTEATVKQRYYVNRILFRRLLRRMWSMCRWDHFYCVVPDDYAKSSCFHLNIFGNFLCLMWQPYTVIHHSAFSPFLIAFKFNAFWRHDTVCCYVVMSSINAENCYLDPFIRWCIIKNLGSI